MVPASLRGLSHPFVLFSRVIGSVELANVSATPPRLSLISPKNTICAQRTLQKKESSSDGASWRDSLTKNMRLH